MQAASTRSHAACSTSHRQPAAVAVRPPTRCPRAAAAAVAAAPPTPLRLRALPQGGDATAPERQQQQQQQGQQQQPSPRAALAGVWARDEARSDAAAYDKMLDVLGLTGLQRLTARLIDGIELAEGPGPKFTVKFLTVVPFFKVTETYPVCERGSEVAPARLPRRDLRPGTQTAVAEASADGRLRVKFEWGEPLAGTLTEEYALLPDGALRVRAETAAGVRRAAADTIYRRTSVGADELLQRRRGGGGGARR